MTQIITVSRMMNEEEFKRSTSILGSQRARSEITKVDKALSAFHALPETSQGARFIALKNIVRACGEYLGHKEEGGGGARVKGTQQLNEQALAAKGTLDPEQVFRDMLVELDRAVDEGLYPDTQALDTALEVTRTMPPERFDTMMRGFTDKLGALREDTTLPEETRTMIGELMPLVPLVTTMQYPRNSRSGMRLNPDTRDDPRYTFNVDTQVRGGTSFVLGHIAHELTHVVAHQAFDSSPVMELVRSGAATAEVKAIAAERKTALADLKSALAEDHVFSEFQRSMLDEKLIYGSEKGKLEEYAKSFATAGKITAPEKDQLIAWGEAAEGASGALVEYDTVLNQMLIYMHMWKISPDNPFYVRLRTAAQAAYERREAARAARVPPAGAGAGSATGAGSGTGSASGPPGDLST